MEDHHFNYLSFLDSQVDFQVNFSLMLDFSAFVHDICEQDYTSHFTTIDDVFPTREDLIKWVRGVAFNFGFVVIILRSDKYNGQPGRKTHVTSQHLYPSVFSVCQYLKVYDTFFF